MKKRWWIIAAAIVIILGGCEDKKTSTTTYSNVVAIYMHNPGVYSFMVQQGTTINLIYPGNQKTDIQADVPDGKPMYAEVEDWTNDNRGDWCVVHLNIHSAKEIGGGSYDAGTRKHPDEVQTVPLEAK
jgi:hypothetical protein